MGEDEKENRAGWGRRCRGGLEDWRGRVTWAGIRKGGRGLVCVPPASPQALLGEKSLTSPQIRFRETSVSPSAVWHLTPRPLRPAARTPSQWPGHADSEVPTASRLNPTALLEGYADDTEAGSQVRATGVRPSPPPPPPPRACAGTLAPAPQAPRAVGPEKGDAGRRPGIWGKGSSPADRPGEEGARRWFLIN